MGEEAACAESDAEDEEEGESDCVDIIFGGEEGEEGEEGEGQGRGRGGRRRKRGIKWLEVLGGIFTCQKKKKNLRYVRELSMNYGRI